MAGQVLVIGVVALLATLATGVASGVVTPGTSLECQFSSKYPGITDTPGVSSGTKTICSSSTFTFLRTDQTCIGGVLYSYPVCIPARIARTSTRAMLWRERLTTAAGRRRPSTTGEAERAIALDRERVQRRVPRHRRKDGAGRLLVVIWGRRSKMTSRPRSYAYGDSVSGGMRPLPRPMLLRPGGIPCGDGWAFEIKYDGFRAVVSTENGLQVRSRRGWNMSERVPELARPPAGPRARRRTRRVQRDRRPALAAPRANACSTGTPRSPSRSSSSTSCESTATT